MPNANGSHGRPPGWNPGVVLGLSGIAILGILTLSSSFRDTTPERWSLSLFAAAVPLLVSGYLCTVTKGFQPRPPPATPRGVSLMNAAITLGELCVAIGLGCLIGAASGIAAVTYVLAVIAAGFVVGQSELPPRNCSTDSGSQSERGQ